MTEADAQRKILNRLKRAQGQLGAIIASMEKGADCQSTVTQLSAVSSAIDRAGFAIISAAMRECISPTDAGEHDARQQGLTLDQLETMFIKFT